MSTLGVLSPVESQACLRVFKDLPAATDESVVKKKEKLCEKLFSLHSLCSFYCEKTEVLILSEFT